MGSVKKIKIPSPLYIACNPKTGTPVGRNFNASPQAYPG
jgi:hypothetical protein